MTQTAAALRPLARVTDAELIARVLAGDRIAARDLYDSHAPRVYRLVYRLTGDPELAREFTQDALVRAFSKLADYRAEAAFSTWLHSITVSVVSNGLRKIRRVNSREVDLAEGHSVPAREDNTDHLLRDKLHRAIDQLPEELRTTLILHDIEGFKHAEIAAAMGVAEGTSKSRLSVARARLRVALADVTEELRYD